MKNKNLRIYAAIWAICLALFNVAAFVAPSEIGGASKFGVSFWVAYGVITAAFIGHLLSAVFAFRADRPVRFFYRIPLLTVSGAGIVLTLIAGGVFVALPALPDWIGIIVCAALLAFDAIAVLKASAAAQIVGTLDETVAKQTRRMRDLTDRAEGILRDASEETRETAQKVYDALRFSDPVSSDATADADASVTRQLAEFADAVRENDAELSRQLADALLVLIEERNRICKREKKR